MIDKFKDTDIKITKDGSHTLYSNRFNQTYHNKKGAVSESKHVFFEKNGLMDALKNSDELNILEIGFGTGLNLLLLADKHQQSQPSAQINYHTVEAYPVSPQTIESLNYEQFLRQPRLADKLSPLFGSLKKGVNKFKFLNNISVNIFYGFFSDYYPAKIEFSYIFHDAFSPNADPELWINDVFQKLLKYSHPQAVLTTYCAATKVRAAMAYSGWKVARAEGALGKREMTIASPAAKRLASFKRVNEQRLAQRFEDEDF